MNLRSLKITTNILAIFALGLSLMPPAYAAENGGDQPDCSCVAGVIKHKKFKLPVHGLECLSTSICMTDETGGMEYRCRYHTDIEVKENGEEVTWPLRGLWFEKFECYPLIREVE